MMAKRMAAVVVVAAPALLLGAAAAGSVTPPSTGLDWISLREGIEFQPASVEQAAAGDAAANSSPEEYRQRLRQAQDRFLAEQSSSSSSSSTSHQHNVEYVDSAETYYDGYAQAWRYIGFYTDCSPNQSSNYDYDDRRRKARDLNSADDQETPCYRYLLWAAVSKIQYIQRLCVHATCAKVVVLRGATNIISHSIVSSLFLFLVRGPKLQRPGHWRISIL
jgi:hypothetical protein